MIKIITTYGQLLLLAMGRTLLLAFLGLIFACILGMIFGLLSVVKNKACNIIAQIFVFLIRGAGLLCILWYSVSAQHNSGYRKRLYAVSTSGRRYLPCLKLRRLYG